MLLALKCLSSNKNMRNKHIKISPLKVVSCSSFSLPEASPRKLASQDQQKTILLKRATPEHFSNVFPDKF